MKKEDLRIVFFGTPEFAVESLRAIHDAGYDVAAVVTMPDKQAGRGHKLLQSPVKEYASSQGIRVLQPSNLKSEDFLHDLREIGANLFVVIAFRMLPESVWSMPELGTFNLHASLLPHYRGAAPINWAIINGEKSTGVSTFFLKHEIDTGDILKQRSTEIEDDDDAGTLHDKLMVIGAELTLETLEGIVKGELTPIPQKEVDGKSKAAPKIFHETCFIDWNKSSDEIVNFVRGLSPYPAARTMLQFPKTEKTEYKIFKVRKVDGESSLQPGITDVSQDKLKVGCRDGAVEVLSLQAPGKRRMPSKDFLNGLKR